jgi:hypothetical protein
MTPPIVQFGRYREVADEVSARIAGPRIASAPAERFAAHPAQVIVASRGVAEAIASRLLDIFPEGFSGVTLQAVESLARRVINAAGEFPRVADEAERRLIMRNATRRLSDPMLQTRGIPAMLERSYRDIRDNGLTLAEFDKRMRSNRVLNRPRLDVFLSVWKEYERQMAILGALDPADLLARAATLIERRPALAAPQIIAGFYDLTGSQQALLSALARAERIDSIHVPVPSVGGSYRFSSRFVEFLGSIGVPSEPLLHARSATSQNGAMPRTEIMEQPTREDEIRSVCQTIRSLIDSGVSPQEIGIVSRSIDAWDASLVERFAQRSGFGVVRRVGTPLRAHRIGRALALLIRLREENFSRGHVIEILRCGLRLTTRTNARWFDQATRVCGIAGGTGSEVRRARVKSQWAETIEEYAIAVSEIESLVAPVAEATGGEEWADWLTSVAGMFSLKTDLDIAAADEVQRIARILRRAAATKLRFDAGTILDALEQAEVAATQSGLPTVWYGDVMKMRGRTLRYLFAIRMQDDVFPQRRNEDPLLPDRDRRVLGIPEVGNGRDEEQLLLQLILDSSIEATRFSFAATDGLGKVLRASQLVKNLALSQDEENASRILNNFSKYLAERVGTKSGAAASAASGRGNPEAPGPLPEAAEAAAPHSGVVASHSGVVAPDAWRDDPRFRRQLQLMTRAGTASLFDGYLSADPRVDQAVSDALAQLSPTQLEEFGECPQKFLLKTLLGVKEIDDPEREVQINIRDKGSIDHRILERFYRQLTEEGLWDQLLRDPASLGPVAQSGAAASAASGRGKQREVPSPLPEAAEAAAPHSAAAPNSESAPHPAAAGPSLGSLPPAVVARLDAIIEDEFARFADEHPPFNATLRDMERRNTIANLHAFVAADLAELIETGLVPHHFEWRFGPRHRQGVVINNPEPFRVEAETVSLSVSGSIDRIDAGPSSWRILDYKSGKARRHESIGEKIDRGLKMQLPLYAMAVAQFFKVDPKNITAAIKPLAATDTKAESFAFTLSEKESSLRSVLSLFIRSINARVFPAVPSGGYDGACKYCPVNLSCRTAHDTEERYATGRLGDPRTLLALRETES